LEREDKWEEVVWDGLQQHQQYSGKGGGKWGPEHIHRVDEMRDSHRESVQSTDDEAYEASYKPKDDVNLDESNKSNHP